MENIPFEKGPFVTASHQEPDALPQIAWNDVDRRIWEEELDAFVPRRVFDVHTHAYRWAFNTDPEKDRVEGDDIIRDHHPEASWRGLEHCDAVLMPGREVHRLVFPYPFTPSCDFEACSRYVAEQIVGDPASGTLMLVQPPMTEEYLEAKIAEHGFLGFKPYRYYSITGDAVDCRITDFMTEAHLAVADRHGLLVTLHMARRDGIADPANIEDLQRLSAAYPNVKWILAHCARSYSAWAIEKAATALRQLPNLWYDTSSVCESDAIEALCAGVGVDRVMYGSDDIPVGVMRGKYIVFGFAWGYLSENNHSIGLSHCNGAMTFTRYEQLRAMRRAAMRLGLSSGQIEDMFCNTATQLIESVRPMP